jgi:hypothetical protein
MINELKRMWMEVVIALFEVLSQNLPGWTKENHRNLIQVRQSPGRLNQRPPEYEAGVLITLPQHLVS